LCACTREFLSHPIEDKKHLLIDHLIQVGKISQKLFSSTNFKNKEISFYSGLLHDIGKLNPFYQELFNETQDRKKVEEHVSVKYVQQHSVFSTWAAKKLLSKSGLDYDLIDKILVLIYGHHSNIRRNLGDISQGKQFIASQMDMIENIRDFSTQVLGIPEFSRLNWASCIEKFSRPIGFDVTLGSRGSSDIDDFLEISVAFSCLLQADRGSFEDWEVSKFDLSIDTTNLVTTNLATPTKLGNLRTRFQEEVMYNYDISDPIVVINAPTGIGKTKVFLDLIAKYKDDEKIERVFYFSPLLALTEDFEGKFAKTISNEQKDDVLYYTHLFAGTLEEKIKDESGIRNSNRWIFLNESFNKKFVITTTQRLLMTLYCNKAREKLKLASFRNSVLIIDEVQTIPKFILSNLKKILIKMNQYMGTKIILVSATIPHEIRDIKKVLISGDILSSYLEQTQKQISIEPLVISTIPINKTLIMANTRKKAVNLYAQIIQEYPINKIHYLSTGIRKKNRSEMLKEIPLWNNFVLVSTQVVEAGVDISFSNIFREAAPLDNIIQVMGRLNREGTDSNAKLVIYQTDDDPTPYSPLEFAESWSRIHNIHNSKDLYGILEQYYSEISTRNSRNIDNTVELEDYIHRMDFDSVWDFVNRHVFAEDDRDTVFIPELENWDGVKNVLMTNLTKDAYKKFGEFTASLPVSVDKIGRELFDQDLLEKNILLPKKENLETVYDENMGLDKWLVMD
jgi:CRISPR-associated endonuclease/helicase Cas3